MPQPWGRSRRNCARPDGKPIAGFSFEDCDPLHGNYLERTVTWKGQADVAPADCAARASRLPVASGEALCVPVHELNVGAFLCVVIAESLDQMSITG